MSEHGRYDPQYFEEVIQPRCREFLQFLRRVMDGVRNDAMRGRDGDGLTIKIRGVEELLRRGQERFDDPKAGLYNRFTLAEAAQIYEAETRCRLEHGFFQAATKAFNDPEDDLFQNGVVPLRLWLACKYHAITPPEWTDRFVVEAVARLFTETDSDPGKAALKALGLQAKRGKRSAIQAFKSAFRKWRHSMLYREVLQTHPAAMDCIVPTEKLSPDTAWHVDLARDTGQYLTSGPAAMVVEETVKTQGDIEPYDWQTIRKHIKPKP